MKNNKAIQKIPEYQVEKYIEKSDILIRGLQQLGLLTNILKLISDGDTIKIRALNGTRTIKSSENTFRHTFSDFIDLHINENSIATDETEVLIYEVIKEANVYQMFKSLNKNFEQMCLTQDQILEFIDKYKEYKIPSDKHIINHFLFKANDKVFISQICIGLNNRNHFPKWFDGYIGDEPGLQYPADGSFRVVIPKL